MQAEELMKRLCDQIDEASELDKDKKQRIFDPFEAITEPVEEYRQTCVKKSDVCEECGGKILRSEMGFECSLCGQLHAFEEENIEMESSVNNYNTIDYLGPVGSSGLGNQKGIVLSNYPKVQKKNTDDQMLKILFQYGENSRAPSKQIMLEAAKMYNKLQQYYVKRGRVRLGTMAACLYRVCKYNDVPRKPKEIADLFHIAQSDLSNGEKVIDSLEAEGIMLHKKSLTYSIESEVVAFLNRYFAALNIPNDSIGQKPTDRPNYKEFSCRLIRFISKYKISANSNISSQCAGTIYIMSTKRPELKIKTEQIEKECDISKSTFLKFKVNVQNTLTSEDTHEKTRSRLRRIFKKYQMNGDDQ